MNIGSRHVCYSSKKLYKGFKVILEDGTEEIPTWKKCNGFKINDDPVQNKADKRKGDDGNDSGLVDAQ